MKYPHSLAVIASLTIAFGSAPAASFSWLPTAVGTTYNWTTGSNWDTNPNFPNAAGDVANLMGDLAGNQTISLGGQAITLGTLNIGDSGAATPANTYTVNTGTLVFQSATPGGATAITGVNVGSAVQNQILADVLLGGSSPLTVTTFGPQTLAFGGRVDLNSNQLTFATASAVSISGPLSGSGLLLKTGTSSLSLSGSNTAYTGPVVINGGSVLLLNKNTGYLGSTDITINGNAGFTGGSGNGGSSLTIGDNSAIALIPQRLNPNVVMTLNGGGFSYGGQALKDAVLNATVTENIKELKVLANSNLTVTSPSPATASSLLHITTLTRNSGAVLQVRAANFSTVSATNQVVLIDNIGDYLVGAGGLVTSTTASIVPWMVGGANPSNEVGDFMGYDSVNGLKIVTYQTDLNAAGAAENVSRSSGQTLSSSKTINSLKFNHSSQTINLNGNTLTVASGAVILAGTAPIISNGTMNFGAREGIVSTPGTGGGSISAILMGSGGFTKGGTGTLTLSGANAYTGTTAIAGGVLRAGAANVLNNTDVTIANTNVNTLGSPQPNVVTAFDLNGFNQSIGSLSGGGSFGGNVLLGTGTLTMNGTGAASYGGAITGAGAVVKNGSGKQAFTGTSSYSGGTQVNLGTLLVNNAAGSATGSGAVIVGATGSTNYGTLGGGAGAASGGVLVSLGGATKQVYAANAVGIIEGAVTVNQYGHLAPGNSVGTTTVGALTLDGGSVLDWEFNASANDFVDVQVLAGSTGGLTFAGTTGINLYQEGTTTTFAAAGLYNLFGYDALSGFNAATSLSVLNGSAGYTYTFVNDTANKLIQLNVAVIPEPSSLALIGLGAMMVFSRRRKK